MNKMQQPSTSTASNISLLPLPTGWEARIDDDGQTFYINHSTRTTTYTHPEHDNAQRRTHSYEFNIVKQSSRESTPVVQHFKRANKFFDSFRKNKKAMIERYLQEAETYFHHDAANSTTVARSHSDLSAVEKKTNQLEALPQLPFGQRNAATHIDRSTSAAPADYAQMPMQTKHSISMPSIHHNPGENSIEAIRHDIERSRERVSQLKLQSPSTFVGYEHQRAHSCKDHALRRRFDQLNQSVLMLMTRQLPPQQPQMTLETSYNNGDIAGRRNINENLKIAYRRTRVELDSIISSMYPHQLVLSRIEMLAVLDASKLNQPIEHLLNTDLKKTEAAHRFLAHYQSGVITELDLARILMLYDKFESLMTRIMQLQSLINENQAQMSSLSVSSISSDMSSATSQIDNRTRPQTEEKARMPLWSMPECTAMKRPLQALSSVNKICEYKSESEAGDSGVYEQSGAIPMWPQISAQLAYDQKSKSLLIEVRGCRNLNVLSIKEGDRVYCRCLLQPHDDGKFAKVYCTSLARCSNAGVIYSHQDRVEIELIEAASKVLRIEIIYQRGDNDQQWYYGGDASLSLADLVNGSIDKHWINVLPATSTSGQVVSFIEEASDECSTIVGSQPSTLTRSHAPPGDSRQPSLNSFQRNSQGRSRQPPSYESAIKKPMASKAAEQNAVDDFMSKARQRLNSNTKFASQLLSSHIASQNEQLAK